MVMTNAYRSQTIPLHKKQSVILLIGTPFNVIDNTKNSLAHKIAAAATNADSSEDNYQKPFRAAGKYPSNQICQTCSPRTINMIITDFCLSQKLLPSCNITCKVSRIVRAVGAAQQS